MVNFHKSAFQCTANVSESDILAFGNILNMNYSLDLCTYLGCPLITKRFNANTFGQVVEALKNQLPKWKANSLSQAGRSVLIQSCLSAKVNHQMQIFLLPSTSSQLDKVCQIFFGNKDPEAKSPNLIGWDRICKPKYLGELGSVKLILITKLFK